MSNKLTRPALSLKEFMVRQQVLKLYRDIMKAVREVPQEENKKELRDWARTEFRNNKHHKDEFVIKTLVFNGERLLKELQQSLAFSR